MQNQQRYNILYRNAIRSPDNPLHEPIISNTAPQESEKNHFYISLYKIFSLISRVKSHPGISDVVFMRKFVVCMLAVLSALIVSGQTPSDSVNVYFKLNLWQLDPAYRGNASSLESFICKVRTAVSANNLDHIVVHGYTSPDGPLSLNERLARKRGETISSYIAEKTGIGKNMIQTVAEGVAWNELRRIVTDRRDVPTREQIMEILDSASSITNSGGVFDRNKCLQSLDGGNTWRWLLDNIFPQLRHSFAVSIYLKSDGSGMHAIADKNDSVPDVTLKIPQQFAASDRLADMGFTSMTGQVRDAAASMIPNHRFAIKTNLLYDAALMPNIEIEWLINNHWSVSAEWNIAWWGDDPNAKSYRISEIGSEVRYWIKPRAPWHGMYAGLSVGGGWYDLWYIKNPGYYGEGMMTAASFGYMWPIGKNFSLSAEIGAGYFYTRYKEYIPYDGHYVYQRTKSLNYIGPVMLKFSIACRFSDRNKPKRYKSSDYEE